MAIAAPKTCNHPGCPNTTSGAYCAEHKKMGRMPGKPRPSAHAQGYDRRWRKAREWFLRRNPLCIECKREGISTPATVVDHVVPHGGDLRLFWDSRNNWQPLCTKHHNRKTAKEDGGFGNKRKGGDDDGHTYSLRSVWKETGIS